MKKKLGILVLATSLLAFLYLTWELMTVSFGFAYFFEQGPPTIEQRVTEISFDILKRFSVLWLTLILIQYLTFKYLIDEKKIIQRLVYFFFITLGTTAMIYGYQVSDYVRSEQKKNSGQPEIKTELAPKKV